MAHVATRVLGAFALALTLFSPSLADSPLPPGDKEPAWILSPNPIAPDQEFDLSLLSYRYSCANEYANHSVDIQAGAISLGFTTRLNPAVLCPAIYKPYGPVFKMPALKPGTYKVSAVLYQPCHFSPVPCMSIPVTEFAGELTVGFSGRITYTVMPDRVSAGQAFSLKLAGNAFNCATEFSMQSSVVQEGKISLTFHDRQNPAVKCASIPGATYGPTYRLGALKAGVYQVWADRLPACAPEGCKMASTPELAGKLLVEATPEPRKGWFLKEQVVLAQAPFSMTLLNHDYGSCQTEFTNTSAVAQNGRIDVTFAIKRHPDRVCVADFRPHGPTFKMQGMRTGTYPVYVNVMPACVFEEPRCAIGIPVPMIASDTLQVVQTLGVSGGKAPGRAAPQAAWRNDAFTLRLPEGAAGAWRAEVLAMNGRRLGQAAFDAEKGLTANLGLAVRPEPGLYLVRLTSARTVHTLRVTVD